MKKSKCAIPAWGLLSLLGLILATVIWSGPTAESQTTRPDTPDPTTERAVKFMFWNLENLFDTENDPENDGDDEYLPEKGWNDERYARKLANLSEAIAAVEPHLLAVCEVENARVLHDLARTPKLKELGFKVAHRDTQDHRGIDLALLYRSPCELSGENAITLHAMPDTRGILEVAVKVKSQPLTVFVNHWPSRWGGVEKSEPRRLAVAKALRQRVLEFEPEDDILILGDLNDEPFNRSVRQTLAAVRSRNAVLHRRNGELLYNPMWRFFGKPDVGTYYYNRDWIWDLFDQCIVSKGLLLEPGLRLDEESLAIHAPKSMRDDKQRPRWFRRKRGTDEWYEGYSDHFAIWGRLTW